MMMWFTTTQSLLRQVLRNQETIMLNLQNIEDAVAAVKASDAKLTTMVGSAITDMQDNSATIASLKTQLAAGLAAGGGTGIVLDQATATQIIADLGGVQTGLDGATTTLGNGITANPGT